jgi:hypothetical protein
MVVSCLADKIVAVVTFVTHLTINTRYWSNLVKKKNVTEEGEQRSKRNRLDIEDGLEHEPFVEHMKSHGTNLPVVVVSDDVHNERVPIVMKSEKRVGMKVAPEEIEKVQQWMDERKGGAHLW